MVKGFHKYTRAAISPDDRIAEKKLELDHQLVRGHVRESVFRKLIFISICTLTL